MTELRLPLSQSITGALAVLETGSAPEIAQRAAILCSTHPGDLDDVVDFGLFDQTFRKHGADVDEVKRQLDEWIPEAAAVVERDPDALIDALDIVGVKVAGT